MSTKAEIFERIDKALEGEDFLEALFALEHMIATAIVEASDGNEEARQNFEASVNRQMRAVQFLISPDSDEQPSATVCRVQ